MAIKVVIMGAAGRDFHNLNVYFRDNPNYEVVAFTVTQRRRGKAIATLSRSCKGGAEQDRRS